MTEPIMVSDWINFGYDPTRAYRRVGNDVEVMVAVGHDREPEKIEPTVMIPSHFKLKDPKITTELKRYVHPNFTHYVVYTNIKGTPE